MNKTDEKYKPLYKQQLKVVSELLNQEFNLDEDSEGSFIDKRVGFGYAIFVLERVRVDKLTKEIQKVSEEGFDKMFELGKLHAIDSLKQDKFWSDK